MKSATEIENVTNDLQPSQNPLHGFQLVRSRSILADPKIDITKEPSLFQLCSSLFSSSLFFANLFLSQRYEFSFSFLETEPLSIGSSCYCCSTRGQPPSSPSSSTTIGRNEITEIPINLLSLPLDLSVRSSSFFHHERILIIHSPFQILARHEIQRKTSFRIQNSAASRDVFARMRATRNGCLNILNCSCVISLRFPTHVVEEGIDIADFSFFLYDACMLLI